MKKLSLYIFLVLVFCNLSANAKDKCDVSKPKSQWTMCIGTELDPSNNGYKYVGEWKDGMRNGQGIETFADGYKYVGQQKNGKRHGQGTETWNGYKYVGEFKNGKKHGQGTETWPDSQDGSYLFGGDLWTDCDLLTKDDPTTFKSIEFVKEKKIKGYDHRRDRSGRKKVSFKVFIFKANFEKGNKIRIQVNAEFENKDKAEKQALRYAKMVGQLPYFLRTKNLKTITIHKGNKNWAAGNNDILVYTKFRSEHTCLEEVMMHEGGHASLDWRMGGSVKASKWNKAAKADGKFISLYAKENPKREDVAETINWWIAVRCKKDRISETNYNKILKSIPNRIKYLDEQKYDMYPLVCD